MPYPTPAPTAEHLWIPATSSTPREPGPEPFLDPPPSRPLTGDGCAHKWDFDCILALQTARSILPGPCLRGAARRLLLAPQPQCRT